MVTGIIVTHGRLGEELLATARLVVGDFSSCYAVTNDGKTLANVSAEIQAIVDKLDGEPCVVFIDFMGGSCSHACLSLDGAGHGLVVMSGVNLPMLLAFLNKRDEVDFDQLPSVIMERSHNSIQALDPTKI